MHGHQNIKTSVLCNTTYVVRSAFSLVTVDTEKTRQTQQKVIYCYTRQLVSTQLWGHHQAIV
jgi:hypothetical protein